MASGFMNMANDTREVLPPHCCEVASVSSTKDLRKVLGGAVDLIDN
jgi:hypothetical protein